MFSQELEKLNRKEPNLNNLFFSNKPLQFTDNSIDLQYQICNTFLKQTRGELMMRESQVMESSKQLLEKINCLTKKDPQSNKTIDTLTEQAAQFSYYSEEPKSIKISRKKPNLFSSKKSINQFNEYQIEIKSKCSIQCHDFFIFLVAEYKKNQNKIKSIDNKDCFSKKVSELNRFHEENIILKKKLEYQEETIRSLTSQIDILSKRNKINSSKSVDQITTTSNTLRYIDINNKVYRDIKNYLLEKQGFNASCSQKIQQIEGNVLKTIQNIFINQKCLKCCDILKKLKDSIIKYKKYLEGESQEIEKIYEKYKKILFSFKTKPQI